MEQKNSYEIQLKAISSKFNQIKERKKYFRIVTIVFLGISVAMMIIINISGDVSKTNIVSKYLSSTDYNTLTTLYDIKLLRNREDTYSWFKENYLGCDVNYALAGKSLNCDANVNCENTIGSLKAYVDKNNNLIVENVTDGKQIYKSSCCVTEIMLTPINVFYINEDDSSKLYCYSFEESKDSILVDESVLQFTLYGDYVFYLSKDENLNRICVSNGKCSKVSTNCQRFFVCNSLILQNGKDIVQMNFDGKNASIIIKNALIVGADESSNIYYTNIPITGVNPSVDVNSYQEIMSEKELEGNDFCLYKMNHDDKTIQKIDSSNSFIRAVYSSGELREIDYMN